jgi:molybdopterin-containing oxidoreductase family iron-sulfur binding subunit
MMPICVEACPSKALIFGDLEDPGSEVRQVLSERFSIRRKPELGTSPEVFYLV